MFRVKVSVNTCFSWNMKKKEKKGSGNNQGLFAVKIPKIFKALLEAVSTWTLLTVTSLKMFDRFLYESLKSVSANGNHVFLFHLSELQKS